MMFPYLEPSSLQRATVTKFVAIFQIVYCSLLMIAACVGMVLQAISLEDFFEDGKGGNPLFGLSMCIFGAYVMVFIILCLFLVVDIQLLKGANRRNVGKCRMWISLRSLRFMFAVVIFIAATYKTNLLTFQILAILEMVLDFVCILLVQGFVTELKSEDHIDVHKFPAPDPIPIRRPSRTKVTFK